MTQPFLALILFRVVKLPSTEAVASGTVDIKLGSSYVCSKWLPHNFNKTTTALRKQIFLCR
jgi:hypothetical protein